MLIGEPVAATPGLGPQADVPVETGVLELELAAAVVDELLELLLLLLPHPASAISASAPNKASKTPLSGTTCLVLTDPLLSSVCEPGPGPPEVGGY